MNKTKEKAETLNLWNSIIFTGRRTDTPELLSAIDIFILTSIFEGVAISVVEVQTSGLPFLHQI